MVFRELRADEIECRVAQISENKDKSPKGLSLLLYKDARVDQNILDETVGPMNWQRDHKELKSNIYCGISIWDEKKQIWVTKWDCGKESFTESEKGEASDSFKRAGFNWGIGRALYTAPFIWVKAELTDIIRTPNGKLACKDNFEVSEISYKDGKIVSLSIVNKGGDTVFSMGKQTKKQEPKETPKQENRLEPVFRELNRIGYSVASVVKTYKIERIDAMTDEMIADFLKKVKDVPTKGVE